MTDSISQLDEFDKKLISLLRMDGRMSFTDIAQKLNVAISTVRNRYNKLVEDKVLYIMGWVDPMMSEYNSYNRVTIEVVPSNLIESVADELMNVEEISFLAITSGEADIEINLMCKNNDHLLDVMKNKILPVKGVHRTNSAVYYEVRKWAAYDLAI